MKTGVFPLISILIFFTVSVSLQGFDLSLAGIYQYTPDGSEFVERNITEDLLDRIRENDRSGVLSLKLTRGSSIPKSILDAAELSDAENIDFLLYGFLKAAGNYDDLEVKLYDREAGAVKAVFYAKNGTSGYNELLQTMSDRIIAYFHKILGTVAREAEKEKEYGVIDIEFGSGYWIPFYPWAESLMGLVSVHLDSSITPADPLFNRDIFSFAVKYGIGLDYSLGMNREGYERFFLHSGRFGFPVAFSARWHMVNMLVFRITPGLQVDILLQDRLYQGRIARTSSAFSLSAGLGYEYIFPGTRSSMGISFGFHTAFYTDILFSADSSLYYRYTFNSARKGDKDE